MIYARSPLMMLVPSHSLIQCSDLQVLMNVGLLSITASVYQLLRGAEMLFAALFAVVFLKRRCEHA